MQLSKGEPLKKAIVIIPTYNERDNIQKVIPVLLEIFDQISNWQLSVLVVDDSSPDGTADHVRRLAKQDRRISLLINPTKAGLGGAYLKGMAEAFGNLGAEVVFEFDADLSHDPHKIPEFLAKIDQGADLVLGSRYVRGGGIPADWGWHRKFLSVVGNIIIMTVLTNSRIRDWTTGYRAITRRVYETVHPELHSERFSGYTFQIGFLHKAVRRGFKVAEVPFVFVDRTIGHSKLGPEYIRNTLLYIFKVRAQELYRNRFLRFVAVGGFGALVQLLSLHIYRYLIPVNHLPLITAYQEATLLSIETAIVSNFIWSNLFTFSDRKLSLAEIPVKFAQFNLASLGSLLIQFVISSVGELVLGLFTILTLPVIGFSIDTGFLYAVIGILTGMFWNFFAYNTFIWRQKSPVATSRPVPAASRAKGSR